MNKTENNQMNVDISGKSVLLSREGKATKCQSTWPEDVTVTFKKEKKTSQNKNMHQPFLTLTPISPQL